MYIVIFGGLLSYQWFQFGSPNDYTSSFGNNFDGYSNIREKQEYAKQWEGDLTEEVLQAMVKDYQERVQSEEISDYEMTDWISLNSWVQTLWPELEEADNPYIMLRYVDPSQLTGLEERREKAIDNFLELNGQTGAEREYFLSMDANVEMPLQYRWTEGWSFITADFIEGCGVVFVIFLAIAIAPVFCGEWHNNTKALIGTTKHGWNKIAIIKVLVSLLFALELYAIITISSIFLQIVFLGTEGGDMPIQCIKILAIAPWTVLQAESLTKTTYVSLIVSLAIVFVPMSIAQFLPLWGQKILELIPFVGSPTDIFRTNAYHVFGHTIWSPYLLITIPITLGLICLPVAIHFWAKRSKV